MAWASTVAVVVPSPATSDVLLATSRTICAPMFARSFFRSISLATVTPSLVIVGDPNCLSMMTLRPLGPSVTLTASANWLTPRRIACRDWSPYVICFAMMSVSYDALSSPRFAAFLPENRGGPAWNRCGLLRTTFDDGQHVILFHDEVLAPVQFDLLAGILAEEDPVAGSDVERDALAVAVRFPVTRGDDGALLRLLFRAVRNDDAADPLFAFVEAVHDDAVVERSYIHSW